MPKCLFCEKTVPPGATSCPHCRAPLQRGTAPDRSGAEDRVRVLLSQGKKIEAIKAYREQTGVGLAEAKSAIEAMERGETPPAAGLDAASEREILDLLRAGQKIEAIRRYRTQTRSGLKEAREAVEAMARREGIASRGGCGALTFALIAAALGAAAVAGIFAWMMRA